MVLLITKMCLSLTLFPCVIGQEAITVAMVHRISRRTWVKSDTTTLVSMVFVHKFPLRGVFEMLLSIFKHFTFSSLEHLLAPLHYYELIDDANLTCPISQKCNRNYTQGNCWRRMCIILFPTYYIDPINHLLRKHHCRTGVSVSCSELEFASRLVQFPWGFRKCHDYPQLY